MTLPTSMLSPSPSLTSGYVILEQLYVGSRTAVYRAMQTAQQQSIVLKVLQSEYPNFKELAQFRNQYTITKNLAIPGIIQPLSLEPLENSYALVMEDWGGISLEQYAQQQPLEIAEVLSIAIQVSEILHDLHQHRVIHKDIKPANLLIHPDSKQIKLIDFSIASLLPKETQEIRNPNALEGTLAYCAPEQTGRMNRGIDYRADYYGFGVTLYQLLTGTLPFVSDDPLELVHCHIAKMPILVDQVNPKVPSIVAAIVAKLMAKNAEDRYQTALGIKQDLTECLNQWNATGRIPEFPLGQWDWSDRFIIPEKLYGREAEVQTLLDAVDRVAQGSAELMLIAGFSGIGKTAVVNEIHKPLCAVRNSVGTLRQRGYFIKGKFDQLNRNIPLSAFVQALRDLMGQLLAESDAQLAQWRNQILEAVGENGQLLVEVIPELEHIIGTQSSVPELAGSAAQNRFNVVFQKFIGVFSRPEHPLVLFLDDLQWADSASLQFIQLLMSDHDSLFMLGAYRDNEVSPTHPFILTVEALKQAQAVVNTITLAPLAFEDTNQLIADALHCSIELAKPLTEFIDRKTKGNPFFTTQFLKALYEDGSVRFNTERRYWEYDLTQVKALSLTEDVVEFIALQLQKLPAETQTMLKLAACIGNQFDLATLTAVRGADATPQTIQQRVKETATALWKALQEGLILPTSEAYKFFQEDEADALDREDAFTVSYRFFHDRIQQAAYSLIPDDAKPATHLQLGQLLLENHHDQLQSNKVFEIVNQLNLGQSLITEPIAKHELATLNFLAGQQAKQATAYGAAFDYFQTAIQRFTPQIWQENYALALELHTEAIEASYLKGDFTAMNQLLAILQQNATEPLDCVKAQETQIEALVAQGKLLESVQLGLQILAQFGIHFPEHPTPEDYGSALERIRQAMSDRTPLDLLNLPITTDSQAIGVMRVLVKLGAPVYLAAPALYPLLMFYGVELSIRGGVASPSILLFASYGLLQCALSNDYASGNDFGQLALALSAKSDDREFQARVSFINGFFITHWQSHIAQTLPYLQAGYTQGLENGDSAYAGYSAYGYCLHHYFLGHPLPDLLIEIQNYQQALQNLNQGGTLNYQLMYHQIVLNLLGKSETVCTLAGTEYDEVAMLPVHEANSDYVALAHLYISKLVLNTWFDHWKDALAASNLAEPYLGGAAALITIPIYYFYDSLVRLTQLRKSRQTPSNLDVQIDLNQLRERIEQNLQKLQRWATSAPMNYQHKLDLVKAEWHRCFGERIEAMELYDRAIAGAKANGYIQEEGWANELAAQFYLDWGREKFARSYLQEAYYCYAHWGAKAKTDDLERRYSQWFAPNSRTHASQISSSSARQSASGSSSADKALLTTRLNSAAAFDLSSILKAYQSLCREIHWDKLITQLMDVLLQNAGARKGALLLLNESNWIIEAMSTITLDQVDCQTRLPNSVLQEKAELPINVIQTVQHSLEAIVMDDASQTPLGMSDPYLVTHQPKSILCTPILSRGKLIAILYLENALTSGAFTSDRLEILQLLTQQAAISLENAQLYQQLEQKVQQRTQELQEKNHLLSATLEELKQTQAQLIQSEKMSSLGQLVAGIAHEINNPISFIYSNLNHARDYCQTILDGFEQYAQQYPEPPVSVQEQLEDIQFIRQDLPRLIDSMQGGADRIYKIVLELRNFARLDEADVKLVNIHTGIESTLLMIQHRCQAEHHRPEINIIKQYGNLPKIQCYARQLNQVFMNVLMNAIDAIDSMRSETWNTTHQPTITIETTFSPGDDIDNIEIRIADNGTGIPDEVKPRIFDPFFTTKDVGQGTGLGLSESYAIVTKHGGSLDVFSELNQGTTIIIRLPLQ